MNYIVVTNNPNVKEVCEYVLFVDGTFLEVLINVRNLVHKGYELISHPLGASIRMMYSPYRSVVVGNKLNEINRSNIDVIENSIYNYKKTMQRRNPDVKNSEDYAVLDFNLLRSALCEIAGVYN